MPERWERELAQLRQVEMREPAIRERIERGPSGVRRPPRTNALLAGVVAGAVVVAGIAALWQLDRNIDGVGDAPIDQPTPGPGVPLVVTVDIRRSSEENGDDPSAIARFGSQEQWMCPDHWTLVDPNGTDESVIFDCGQSDVFQAPVGTPIEVTGDFATLHVSAGVTGNRDPGTGEVVPPLEPGTIVTLGYEVTWNDGSEASFSLLLTVQDSETATDEPGVVVRLHGLGERSFAQPTATFSFDGRMGTACTEAWEWTVADGQTDGAEAFCSGGPVTDVPPGTPIAIEAGTATRVSTTRTTTPFFEGDVGLVVSAQWPEGTATFVIPLTVTEATPGTEPVVLDCVAGDRISFAPPKGGRILPGGSAYVRGNLLGVLPHDVIEQMTRVPNGETEWDGVWQIVRDGSVVAAIDFPSLGGVACRGSGIQEV